MYMFEIEFEFEFALFIRANCFALHDLCSWNPTSWAASVAQLVEQLP